MLGFRARNQYVGRDFEIQAPEFLMAGEVLRWDSARSTSDQRKMLLARCCIELVFRMRVNPSPVSPERVHQQQFRRQRGGGPVLALKLRHAVAESREE